MNTTITPETMAAYHTAWKKTAHADLPPRLAIDSADINMPDLRTVCPQCGYIFDPYATMRHAGYHALYMSSRWGL